jgi:NADH:ubiquinone oxidoreductase subunit F (NADH-binding)
VELLWLLIKVVGLIIAMMGSGAVLGFLYAREKYIEEIWDKELLIRALQREAQDD